MGITAHSFGWYFLKGIHDFVGEFGCSHFRVMALLLAGRWWVFQILFDSPTCKRADAFSSPWRGQCGAVIAYGKER